MNAIDARASARDCAINVPSADHAGVREAPSGRRRVGTAIVAADLAAAVAVVIWIGLPTSIWDAAATLLVLGLVPLLLAAVGGYELHPREAARRPQLLGRLFLVSSCCLWSATLIGGSAVTADRADLLAASVLVPGSWYASRMIAQRYRRATPERTVVVGTGRMATYVAELARRHPEQGLHVIGFIDDDPLELADDLPPVLGAIDQLGEACMVNDVDRVVVAFTPGSDEHLLGQLRACDRLRVKIDVVPRLFDLLSPSEASLGALTLIPASRRFPAPRHAVIKRSLDLVGAALLLAMLAPVMLVAALAIRVGDRGPVFYRQARVGQHGTDFRMWKFRTMVPDADRLDAEAYPTGDDIAELAKQQKHGRVNDITAVGAVLRRTSIDELPQLWNVIRGDMSLVGPRPIPTYQAAALEPWQHTRLDVRPGITGLWQVLGRSEIEWHERMQLDYSYARHQCITGDISILARTFSAVLSKRGAV